MIGFGHIDQGLIHFGGRDFSCHNWIKFRSGAHPWFYIVGIRVLFTDSEHSWTTKLTTHARLCLGLNLRMCGALPPLPMPIHGLMLKLKDSVAFVPLFIVWKLIRCFMCILKLREVIADVTALCVEVETIICNENIRFFFIMPLTFLMLIWTV